MLARSEVVPINNSIAVKVYDKSGYEDTRLRAEHVRLRIDRVVSYVLGDQALSGISALGFECSFVTQDEKSDLLVSFYFELLGANSGTMKDSTSSLELLSKSIVKKDDEGECLWSGAEFEAYLGTKSIIKDSDDSLLNRLKANSSKALCNFIVLKGETLE